MIYFIRDPLTKRVKIGLSEKPRARFAQIQTGCPTDLQLVSVIDGGAPEEAALHKRFAQFHVRGEWFAETADLAEYVAALPEPVRVPARLQRPPVTPLDAWMIANNVQSKDLARRLGYGPSFISHLRNAIRQPTLDLAVKLMEITGLEARDFVVVTPDRKSRARAA